MNVAFLGKFGREVVGGAVARVPGVRLQHADTVEQLVPLMGEAEALMLVGPMYSPAVASAVAGARKLRWIQTLSAGYENLQKFGVPTGVTVTNAGDSWAIGVAEHAMALLLALAKRLPEAVTNQRKHVWDRGIFERMASLQGRTMVVVGFGAIGQAVAQRSRAFGMNVFAVTREAAPSPLADRVYPASELEKALQLADAVVLAVPSSPQTVHLLSERTLHACKPGCMVINVARGDVVDQDALAAALRSGHIGGAGLDVMVPEPLPESNALWDAPNLVITPHVAGGGELVTAKLAELVTDNMARHLRGDQLRCAVNAGGTGS